VPSWRCRCRSWFWGTAQRLGLADSVTARALGRPGPSLAPSSRCERFRSMLRTFDSTRNPSPLRAAPDRVRILKHEEAEVFDVMLELSFVKIDRAWVNEADIVEALVDRDDRDAEAHRQTLASMKSKASLRKGLASGALPCGGASGRSSELTRLTTSAALNADACSGERSTSRSAA
jgi:hypothetical protein